MARNIDSIINKFRYVVETHRLDREGAYARWLWQGGRRPRRLGLNEYGCADAANILYTIGDFVSEPEKRSSWIEVLQSLQNPETGLFTEETHHPIHTTAHCTAALELFDAKPLYPMYDLLKYREKDALYDLLENLTWETNAWDASHEGAGIFAALSLGGHVDLQWKTWYFDWLWEHADAERGFWKKDCEHKCPPVYYMAGGFHYLFNYEYAKMPIPNPEKIIDVCLDLYWSGKMGSSFPNHIDFTQVDWVFCITRASRQTPHRFYECKDALRHMAKIYLDYLEAIDEKTHDGVNDLHALFGAVCCVAELQTALPGELLSEKPMRLVLDRRPFI